MGERKIYGYVRVSSRDQNEARQLQALSTCGIPEENLFMDKQSGRDFGVRFFCMKINSTLNSMTSGRL